MSLEKALWKAQEEILANMKLQIIMAERVFLDTVYPMTPDQDEIIRRVRACVILAEEFPTADVMELPAITDEEAREMNDQFRTRYGLGDLC
jgi:hypothetical protein